MPGSLYGDFQESDRILIRFLPSDPTVNHPDAWDWPLFLEPIDTIIMSSFYIFFGAMGCIMLAILYRERKLAREGRPAVAVVSTCARKDRTFRAQYEFRTEDGSSIEDSGYCSIQYEPGAIICVLYLPQNPRRNDPYPLPNFRVSADVRT
jgi:hypothetical protein